MYTKGNRSFIGGEMMYFASEEKYIRFCNQDNGLDQKNFNELDDITFDYIENDKVVRKISCRIINIKQINRHIDGVYHCVIICDRVIRNDNYDYCSDDIEVFFTNRITKIYDEEKGW